MSAANHPRVVFDATQLSRLGAGVSTYIVNLVRALAALQDRRWDLIVLARPEQAELFATGAGLRLEPIRMPSTAYRVVWEQLRLPRVAQRIAAGLIHSPHYSIPLRLGLRRVVTVHDLTYVTMPEHHRASRSWYFRWILPRAVRAADHVLCVSETTRADLLRLYPDVSPAKVSVTRLAVGTAGAEEPSRDELAEVRRRLQLPDHFVLQVGTVEPRKNVAMTLDAVVELRRRDPRVELVLAGQRGWESERLFRRLEEMPFVRYLGHLSDHELAALYRLASVVIMPSHYEGFGLPVLEALRAGTPVVSSGKGGLAEVAGEAAVVPSRDHPSAYADALERLLVDQPYRQAMVRAGRLQAGRFSWQEAARQTAEVYNRLLGLPDRIMESARERLGLAR